MVARHRRVGLYMAAAARRRRAMRHGRSRPGNDRSAGVAARVGTAVAARATTARWTAVPASLATRTVARAMTSTVIPIGRGRLAATLEWSDGIGGAGRRWR